jgi:hypothetical protein
MWFAAVIRRGVCDACDLCAEPAVVITGRVVTLSNCQAERVALSSTWEPTHSPSGKVADRGSRLSAAYGKFERIRGRTQPGAARPVPRRVAGSAAPTSFFLQVGCPERQIGTL